jgi:hypothetical protein
MTDDKPFKPLPRVHSENHLEWLIDDASAASFPASDPSAIAQPPPRRRTPQPARPFRDRGSGHLIT